MSTTKITDYMKLSKEDRQKHIDLSTECKFYLYDRDWNYRGVIKKAGDLYGKNEQMKQAKEALLGFLNIEDFSGNKIHICHLCNCNSYTDKVCINPAHLYFGTVSENHFDIPFEVRQKVAKKAGSKGGKKTTENMSKEQLSERGKKGGKKVMENGTNSMLKKIKCPHCNKEGSLVNMKRWHFDNCKLKPISETLQDISLLTPESSFINLE